MVKYPPKKVFILENGTYTEITYKELCRREDIDASYRDKYYLPLYGMLMEVSKNVYSAFYKERRRQKYIDERARKNGDLSYDALSSVELNGSNILKDCSMDVVEKVEENILLDQLSYVLSLLSEEERLLLYALFYNGESERDIAGRYGISQVAVHKRKHRIFAKIKKLLEIS